jgi:hypothetical protein
MKIFLGTTKETFKEYPKTRFYIEKHKWDCDWYWGFGYIGNAGLHIHFNSVFLDEAENKVDKIFIKPVFTQDEWWVIRDLFIQAYALSKAAEVYQHGGHQIDKAYRLPNPNKEVSDKLNEDLKIILGELWKVLLNEKFFVEKGKEWL